MAAVRRERWTPTRMVAAGAALVGFYATYMAYRNLKAIVPLLRPGDNFDAQLADLDRSLFAGNDPAALLHTLIGTGAATHVLSAFYVAFIVFLPLTIGVALVFSTDVRPALFYVTAQSINWVLGIGSYLLLPSLGPIYFEPGAFADLPGSEVTRLQGVLMQQRVDFLADPSTGHAAEHRGVRLAAHLDELHRARGGAAARARAAAADRALGLARRHHGRHRLPRLALLRRRHRRRADGRGGARAGPLRSRASTSARSAARRAPGGAPHEPRAWDGPARSRPAPPPRSQLTTCICAGARALLGGEEAPREGERPCPPTESSRCSRRSSRWRPASPPTWLTDHVSGLDVSAGQLEAVFIAALTAVLAPAAQWLHGSQKLARFEAELERAALDADTRAAELAGEPDLLAAEDEYGDYEDELRGSGRRLRGRARREPEPVPAGA